MSGGGTANYLRADATWAAPPGVTNLTWTAATRTVASDTGNDAVITLVTSTEAGLAPLSGGGTTNFLRADATWAAPPDTNATNLTWTAATRTVASDTGSDAIITLVSSTDAGLAPASGGGTVNFLRADGTWVTPTDTNATNLTYTAATRIIASDTGTDATLPLVSTGDAGLAPASGGGTSNFLRADGTWTAPTAVVGDGDKGDISITGGVWNLDLTLDAIDAPVASVNFADQQALSFRIENRTSDPVSPTTGQVWLRTNL